MLVMISSWFTMMCLSGVLVLVLAGIGRPQPIGRVAACPVRFVVLGDRTEKPVPGIYQQLVAQVERLKPDFVITVGDAIEGYSEDTTVLNVQWREYRAIIGTLSMPVYLTPGNHDITTDGALETYGRHAGRTYYCFDFAGVHGIVLDNTRWVSSSRLPHDQLAWLADDLQRNRNAANIVVFCHKPFWYQTTALGKPDTLHALFVKFGVDAVFTGHLHRYFSGQYDGVMYTGVGSSGGETRADPDMPQYHFTWVTADQQGLSIAPIALEGVWTGLLPSAAETHEIDRLDARGILFDRPVSVTGTLTVPETAVVVGIDNAGTASALGDTLSWNVPDNWTVVPEKLFVTVAGAERRTAEFSVRCSGSLYPVPSVSLEFPTREGRKHRVTKNLPVTRQVVCRRVLSTPAIDGKLSESVWTDPVTTLFSSRGTPARTDSTAFYFAYDRDNLYLAVWCREQRMDSLHAAVSARDGAVFGEDCAGFFLQPNPATDTVYQLQVNPRGTIFDRAVTANEDGVFSGDPSWDGNWEVAAHRAADFWSAEICVPLAQFGDQARSGGEWRVNFRRRQHRLDASANWQVPIDYDPATFGIMHFR